MIQNRNIAVYVVLTIVTCGIFGLYWIVTLNDDVNTLSNEPDATSGGIVLLLTIVTCGIYGLYWLYKMGEKLDKKDGNSNSGVIYLVIGVFGLSIVSYALMQDRINDFANAPQN